MNNLKMFILFQENIVIILLFDCGYLAFFKKKKKEKKTKFKIYEGKACKLNYPQI